VEDIEVIKRVVAGEVDDFRLLIDKYHRHLLNFIFRLVNDSSIVEDIGQEVFVSVFRSLGQFNDGRGVPFGAWLFVLARNRSISEMRKRKHLKSQAFDEETFSSTNETPDGMLLNKERSAAIDKALERTLCNERGCQACDCRRCRACRDYQRDKIGSRHVRAGYVPLDAFERTGALEKGRYCYGISRKNY
jgi:RNA polymerase sigma-70 factor (ECF subfamily)